MKEVYSKIRLFYQISMVMMTLKMDMEKWGKVISCILVLAMGMVNLATDTDLPL
jgi:hypothetical protein